MTDGSDRWQELDSVLDRVLDGIYDQQDLRRLNEMLRADVEACRRYIHYVELHGRLAWGDAIGAEGEREMVYDLPSASAPAAALVIQTSPELPTTYSPLGGFLFSYAVAAVTVAIGLLVGWMYQISVSPQPIAREGSQRAAPSPIPKSPKTQSVGQITGTFDCQWADASTAAVDGAYVPVGRRYTLASGLMEISYDAGAKVILQGPCIYQVESRIGGYLKLGTLTAKVEKSEVGREASRQSTINNHKSLPPLFSVRTPTAIVTDLGTEFAVEVDKSGASRAHVFVGKVEVRAADGGNSKAASLGPNESARVDFGKDRLVAVVRESGRQRPFVREMPKSLPIALFNTGVGLKKGDADPHWQIVARSDDLKFKPRPAIVRGLRVENFFLEDDPARSQWLSLAAGDVEFPQDVVFVFRTTFDLTGMLPSRAVLRGKFLADDRLVGHPPERPPSAGALASRRRAVPRLDQFPDFRQIRKRDKRPRIRRAELRSLPIAEPAPHGKKSNEFPRGTGGGRRGRSGIRGR